MTPEVEGKNYELVRDEVSGAAVAIKCLTCGRTSHNPHDVEQKYCGHCHVFHEDAAQFRDLYLRQASLNQTEV
jgi:ribosomal protein L37E